MNSPHLPCTSLLSPQPKIKKKKAECWSKRKQWWGTNTLVSSPWGCFTLTPNFAFCLYLSCLAVDIRYAYRKFVNFQFSRSVVSSLWPMDCSIPGFPVHHQLLELAQMHFHQVSDAIQRSQPLSSPCPTAFNLSQHQGLFQWVSSSHQVAQVLRVSALASVLPLNIHDWFPLGWTGWISLQSKGLSRVFSNTQFKSINSSVLSFLYSPTLTSIHDYWKNNSLD